MSATEETTAPGEQQSEQAPVAAGDVVEVQEEAVTATDSQPLESSKHPTYSEDEVKELDTRPCFIRHINVVVKLWGLLTLAGMWVCVVFAIERRADGDFSPWYCLSSTVIVTILELLWYINKCAICKDKGGCCCTCWRVLMWVDNWKKGVIYIILAIPNFIRVVVLVLIVGVILVVLGLVYIAKSLSKCRCFGGKKYVRRPQAALAAGL